MSERFRDPLVQVSHFYGECLVECPRCGRCARVAPIAAEPGVPDVFAQHRVACTACGYTRDREEGGYTAYDDGRDPFFGLPLWLRAPCAGAELWAVNAQHLACLESFVRAPLRERRRSAESGWVGRSMVSRLPGWMKSARHRARVLETIARLQERLSQA